MAVRATPIVLVVEDDPSWVAVWRGQLAGVCLIQHAQTQGDASRLWGTGEGVRLVAIGACTPGDRPNTQGLTAWFRAQDTEVPILSFSSVDDLAKINLEHGATDWVNKMGFAQKVKEMLGPASLEVVG